MTRPLLQDKFGRTIRDLRISVTDRSMVDHNVRGRLRRGATRDQIAQFMIDTVLKKKAGHRINEPDFIQPPRTMSFIGG